MGIDEIVDDVVGKPFETECSKIILRGRDDSAEPHFSGPGTISGSAAGPFIFRLHNTLEKDPKEVMRLSRSRITGSEPMCFDATDYHGFEWTGGWSSPRIHVLGGPGYFVTGEFPQLTTDLPLTAFDRTRNATVNHYAGDLRLPMLELSNLQTVRDQMIEQVSTRWDRTELDLDGASLVLFIDEENDRTTVSITQNGDLQPPYCEVGLADAISFVCATSARPRVTIRYFDNKAILFIRETPLETRSGMPRPIAYSGPRDRAFWNLFLAFLRHFKSNKALESTRFSHLIGELVLVSTGTVHALVLSLVIGIEDLVEQIVGKPQPIQGVDDLIMHIKGWDGDSDLKASAIKVISGNLSRTSTKRHLETLAEQGVVTPEQIGIWAALRPKLAHGKIINYDDAELFTKRNQLITMFYRLAGRLLQYKGKLTDHVTSPPSLYDFQWLS